MDLWGLCPGKKDKGNILNDIGNGINDALVWIDDRKDALAFIGSGVLQIVGGALLDAGGTAGGAALSVGTFGIGTPGGVVIAGASITAGTVLIGTGSVTAAIGLAMLANNSTGKPKDNTETTNNQNKGDYKTLTESELKKRLNADDIHSIKKEIIKDNKAALDKIGSKNPDIGVDKNGNTILIDRTTGKTINTDVPLNNYSN
jgi:hypothetical protein